MNLIHDAFVIADTTEILEAEGWVADSSGAIRVVESPVGSAVSMYLNREHTGVIALVSLKDGLERARIEWPLVLGAERLADAILAATRGDLSDLEEA